MKLSHLIFMTVMLTSFNCLAEICKNANNTISVVDYSLTTTLTAEQNQLGQAVQLVKSQDVNILGSCPRDSAPDQTTYRSYRTTYPIILTEGGWKYLALDPDYLMGAMSITDSEIGVYYPPGDYIHMGRDKNVDKGKDFNIHDSNLIFKLRIAKPFIGSISIPNHTMFDVYVTTRNNDPLTKVVYRITYSGTVTVPQNCTINAGQTITVDLGKLNSAAFKTAGEKPLNAPVKTFNVPIECNADVLSPAHLTLRLQATTDPHISDAVATDNPDVGVVVTDDKGTILKPNDMSSRADFMTDTSGKANVTLKTYPISTTGSAPQEGIFTALACLRIDFA